MGMSIKKLHTVVLLYDIYSLIAHFPEKSLETSFRRFHVLAEQKVSYNRPQPHIAQERQNKYHQLIILESLFEVALKNHTVAAHIVVVDHTAVAHIVAADHTAAAHTVVATAHIAVVPVHIAEAVHTVAVAAHTAIAALDNSPEVADLVVAHTIVAAG